MTEKEQSGCDKGWKDGSCCCNCINQLKLNRHPLNETIGNGSIMDTFGYVCLAPEFQEKKEKRFGIFFEKEHGFCEMYYPINTQP